MSGVDDIIEVNNQFYIRASSPRIEGRTRVLKKGETFALCDRFGDLSSSALGELGLYHEGTRYLSRLTLTLDAGRPLLLSSGVRDDNGVFVADLTNADVMSDGHVAMPRGTIHLARRQRVFPGGCVQSVRVRNYGLQATECRLGFAPAADFADIFEVRGTSRARKGHFDPPVLRPDGLVFRYVGLDGVARETCFSCDPRPERISDAEVVFRLSLEPGEERRISVTVSCQASENGRRIGSTTPTWRGDAPPKARVAADYSPFALWIRRSEADLEMMITPTSSGPYPYAGVPWFCTPFGRDGILTALEVLWLDPSVARGVLGFLAERQADAVIPERDAEPGKILHESRKGEMAALGEVPFGLYYGSVDATPLFVLLAAAYAERSGDREFLARLWPHVERALEWIDRWGDRDGDGFVEYYRNSPNGLVQQGWKDSGDSIFHADGTLAEGPIALCEVQGYVYAAKLGASAIADWLGRSGRADALRAEAATLKERFDRAFWCEEMRSYALALDGAKRPCRVRASNAGHALWTGVAREDRAAVLARTLFEEDSFSGWGIRTVASGQARYNPMSYHDGSVWPHDNALIATGLARYGFSSACGRLLTALCEASGEFEFHRLPELFCGFHRRPGQGPTLYPLACSPQAWSSGAAFLMLQACLGITVDGARRRVRFERPLLPHFLDELRLENLGVGDASLDLRIQRNGDDVRVETLRQNGELEILVGR